MNSAELSSLTFGNEEDLPVVPLPGLEESARLFLEWCAPLLGPDDLAATEAAVEQLLAPGSPAWALHAALERYDAREDVQSWLDEFWADRYLGRRDRIALNANFFFLFSDAGLDQLDRAASLVAASVDYKLLVDTERLDPVVQRGRPLSMEQNKYLFSCTRIPGEPRDTSRTPYSDDWPGPSHERHVVVFVRGRMFRLDVISEDGRPHAVDEIHAGLRAVQEAGRAELAEPGTSVGSLTTKARADWAASRRALLGCDHANPEALDILERALFCVALEDTVPESPRAAGDQLLHGDSANRWFDKSVSLIVFGDGTAGFNGEHCNLDGTTIVSYLDAVLTAPADGPEGRGVGTGETPSWSPVDFVLDADLRADVRAAADAFAEYGASMASQTVSVPGFTSDTAKALKTAPDAFAQMAFQLAHARAKGFIGATYEAIATRHFRHGRTEAMRVVTREIQRFTAAMDDPDADVETRRSAFRAAADKHAERAKECQAGHAPEQHLWELQLIQSRHGAELGATAPLDLYDSPGWRIMRDDYLSTSAVPSPHVKYWGFGSTSTHCIGVGYALLSDRFDLFLSTPRVVADQMYAFADRLVEAVAELQALLTDAG